MDLKSPCEHCGQNLVFPENMLGDQINCPHCNETTKLWATSPGGPTAATTTNPNLTQCPDCGKTVSIRASTCPQCGAPLASQGIAGVPTASPAPASGLSSAQGQTTFASACPQCHSDNTVKCSVAYASGSSTGAFGALGIDSGGNVGSIGGSSSNQTLLARKVAPPQEERIGCLWVGFVVGAFICLGALVAMSETLLGGAFFLLIGGTLCALPIIKSWQIHNKLPEYEKRLQFWNASWVCLRCGRIFKP